MSESSLIDYKPPLTDTVIKAAMALAKQSGKDGYYSDSTGRGDGRLILRARPTGAFWVFSYSPAPEQRDRLTFGRYTEQKTGKDSGAAYTLKEARQHCATEFGSLLKNPLTRNIRAHLAEQEASVRAKREAVKTQAALAVQTERQNRECTLENLLALYVGYLRKNGKSSADDVEGTFRRHVSLAHPELAQRAASSIRKTEAATMVRKVLDEGHGPMAVQLRRYCTAAYNLAASAETNVKAPEAMQQFQIEYNPFTPVKGLPPGNAIDRCLDRDELAHFLRRVRAVDTVESTVMLLMLYAGGQRCKQVLRTPLDHWLPKTQTLHLLDYKGKRDKPRDHYIPLVGEGVRLAQAAAVYARAFYDALPQKQAVEYLFPIQRTRKNKRQGKDLIGQYSVDMVSKVVTQVCEDMIKAGESTAPFTMRDGRRTLTNLMLEEDADGTVSMLCADLIQSHGLSGVVHKNYIKAAKFRNEMTAALRLLEKRLSYAPVPTPDPQAAPASRSNVVQMFPRKAA